jgi:LmbE family N-acetylglucosaminyl deacetylase
VRVCAVSPHLDDAAFSVGGTLAALADAGHEVVVATVFTASVPDPTGFALTCQTDKGLAPDVDYLALRRDEDRAALDVLGAGHLHLGLPEAPHRGYGSAAALFAGVRADDDPPVREALAGLHADLWLGPQALGGHVDHVLVHRALRALGRPTAWWRDVPYVLRDPAARPPEELPRSLTELRLPVDEDRRARACRCYATQLGFQFGGADGVAPALAGLPEPLLADPAAAALLR